MWAALAKMVLSAMVSQAATQAAPKYGMQTPMDVPKNQSQQMDFQQLVQQGQNQDSKLKKLELQDRLPPPETFY